jgi:DnaJ-domain-containing protein 1
MSIKNRIFRIVKSNLNSILGEETESHDSVNYDDEFMREAAEELERELRGEKERYDEKDTEQYYQETNKWYHKPFRDEKIAKAYAKLGVPYGADLKTTRKAWVRLMKKHHPDMHAQSPEKMKEATDLSQEITKAYNDIEEFLKTQKK